MHGAEKVGRAVATVVENARGLPGQMRRAKTNLSIVSRRTAGEIAATVADHRRAAEQRTTVVRNRAQQLAVEKPLHLIAGAAGAAFLVGFALRIWRSS
jgi:hypothetical protein